MADGDCEDGPKYIPLLPVQIPNQNQSHIKCPPCDPGYPKPKDLGSGMCGDVPCDCIDSKGLQGYPGCGPPELQCNSCYDVPTGHQRTCDCESCRALRCAAASEPCAQHVEGNRWQDLRKRSADPEIQAIRDRISSSDGIKALLRWYPDDECLTCVDRKFRQSKQGNLGEAWIHYGAAQDCDFPKKMVHGVPSDTITSAGYDLIRPPLKTWSTQLEEDLKEGIYESNRLYPVGKSHDQLMNLPLKVHPDTTTFGEVTKKDIPAGCLINPPKNRFHVEAENNCCRHLYRMTHGNYNPGEQICRNYEGGFSRTNTFGTPTPCDIAGRWTKKIISTWRSCTPDPPYVNKTYADHLDQRIPKLGKPQDRLCIRAQQGEDFVYGKSSEIEKERPIREIIFNRCPNEGAEKAMQIMAGLKDWIAKVRKNMKTNRGTDMETFYEALIANDKDCNGTIEWCPFIRILIDQRIPRTLETEEFMEALAYVNIFHPAPCNKINYYLLMNLIQGHEDPKFHCRTTTLAPYYMPHTNSCIHFRTTYSDLTSNMCTPTSCIKNAKEQRVHGMPSVRTDRLPRKIRSTKDFTNYGDDGDAYSLIWPSVYTVRGVTARDAFRDLKRDEMLKILCRAGVEISHEEFDSVWQLAKEMDPDGKKRVCFQTFREALCQKRAGPDSFVNYPPDPQITDCCQAQMEKDCVMCSNQNTPKPKPCPCAGVDP